MPDQTIAGRYQLERQIGAGGSSTVHLALDQRLQRQVAIKLLDEHLARDESFLARFRREALAAARLVHPNIVQVFDFGLDERSGRHFIAMEHIAGQSCAELLRERGYVSPGEAVEIVEQACAGLDHAHRSGVVHRDVKPANLLRTPEGVVKLADFGIAKATEDASITRVGSVLGTASYLAPEQARGERAGPAADVYALGVVTYQLVAGRLPYEGSSLTALALAQQRERPPRLDRLRTDVGPGLASAVARALALEQGGRHASAAAMAAALRAPGPVEAALTIAIDAPPQTRIREPAPTPRPAPRTTPRRGRPTSRPRRRARRRLARLLGVLTILALLAGGGILALRQSGALEETVAVRDAIGENVSDSINQLEQLIADNTR